MMASAVSTTTFFTYCQLLDLAHQGDHDLGHHVPVGMLGLDVQGGLDDGAGLHGGDLRIGDRQTAAAVTHHGVELVQAGDDGLDLRHALAHVLGQQLDVGLLGGHELVQRGIQETDGDRAGPPWPRRCPRSRPAAWAPAWPEPSRAAPRCRSRSSRRMAGMRSASKNMCSVRHRPMPSAPNFAGLGGVVGGVRVGADLQAAVLVGPAHDPAELAADGGVHRGDGAVVDLAGGAVHGQPVALVEGLAGQSSNCLFSSSILMAPQPETQHVPMPRATTAAWEVMPPRTVRMP